MLRKYWMVVILGLLCAGVYAQNRLEFSKLSIRTEFLPTPVLRFENYDSEAPRSNQQWMAIRVAFTPDKVSGTSSILWLDNVRMEVEVMFSASYQGKSVMAYTTGRVDFWSIPLDGKKHNAMMLIHPQVLQRYGDQASNNYRKLKIYSRVTFINANNNSVLGRLVGGNEKANIINAAFNEVSSPISGALKLPNLILPVEKTPWALIDIDAYDMTKPVTNTGM